MEGGEVRGGWLIRPYAAADRSEVRRIAGTATGGSALWASPIPDVTAELATAWFTDREPELSLVVARPPAGEGRSAAGSELVGYLLGTRDAARASRHRAATLPWTFGRLVLGRLTSKSSAPTGAREDPARAAVALLGSTLRGRLRAPRRVLAEFPATFHVELEAAARGCGLGAPLLLRFLEALRAQRVPGVHAQTLGITGELPRFLQRAGFQLAASWPIDTTSPDAPRVDLLTWVLRL